MQMNVLFYRTFHYVPVKVGMPEIYNHHAVSWTLTWIALYLVKSEIGELSMCSGDQAIFHPSPQDYMALQCKVNEEMKKSSLTLKKSFSFT